MMEQLPTAMGHGGRLVIYVNTTILPIYGIKNIFPANVNNGLHVSFLHGTFFDEKK